MISKVLKSLAVGLFLTAIVPVSVYADDNEDSFFDFSGNYASAGESVNCEGVSALDMFIAGTDIKIDNSDVINNIFVAGAQIDISNTELGSDIFAAGNTLNITETETDGNVFMAGNSVSFGEDSEAATVFACGNTVNFDGSSLQASLSGNEVYFNGSVEGNVDISGDTVYIGEDANVSGEMRVKSKSVVLSDKADISDYYWEETEDDGAQDAATKLSFWAKALKRITSRFYWIPAALILCMFLCGLFGKQLDEAKESIKTKSGEMVLWGILSWALIPVACIIAGITVIGLPFAAIVCALYVILLCAGLTFAGASLGRLCFPKMHPILASVVGVAAIECIRIIPFIGVIVGIVADMYLLGYVSRSIYLSKCKKAKNEN